MTLESPQVGNWLWWMWNRQPPRWNKFCVSSISEYEGGCTDHFWWWLGWGEPSFMFLSPVILTLKGSELFHITFGVNDIINSVCLNLVLPRNNLLHKVAKVLNVGRGQMAEADKEAGILCNLHTERERCQQGSKPWPNVFLDSSHL